jgi:hypothetical protein
MRASDIVAALGGRMRGKSTGVAKCPAHGDRSPSLSITDGPDGKVLVKCFAGCAQAEVIAALRRLGLWPERAGDAPVMTESERERRRRQEAVRERERARREVFIERTWQETWATAQPARGSPIEAYLRHRGIDAGKLDLDRLPLRWAPRCPMGTGTAPAMVSLMTDALTNEPVGLHRTFLRADGAGKADIEQPKQMLGHAGIIRLSENAEVTFGLGLTEGIENGAAVMASGWRPICACGSLGMLERFPVLGGIEALTIFSDPKAHEIVGARVCAERWAEAGREAVVRIPGAEGDWNDVLGRAA